MQEPYQMQEAHDRINDRWFCWECETEAWKDIRKDFLERTSNE